jgi:hypothetical protein
MITDIYSYAFYLLHSSVQLLICTSFLLLDVDPSQAMNLEARVKDHIKDLQHRIRTNVLLGVGKVGDLASSTHFFGTYVLFQFAISGFVESIQSLFSGKPKKEKFSLAESLHLNGASIEQTTNNVLSLLVGASVELSQCQYATVSYKDHRLIHYSYNQYCQCLPRSARCRAPTQGRRCEKPCTRELHLRGHAYDFDYSTTPADY